MVVCGTDFSPQAQEAARVAARLASARSEPLLLVHVVDELGAEIVLGSPDDGLYDDLRDQLEVEATRLRETGAAVEVRLEAGVPGDRLAVLAASVHAWLVVIGAGVRRVGSIRLGSTAVRLVRRSGTPLLLLRTFAPFHAWLDRQRPLRVLVGDDLEDVGAVALSWLPTLAEIGLLEVTTLYVSTVEPGASGVVAEQLRSRARSMAQVEAAPRVITAGSAADALAQTSGHLDPDLVLVGTSQRSWVSRWWRPSVAAGVVDLTTTSVGVVVPGTTSERRAPARFGRLVALADPSTADGVLAHAVGLGMPSGTVHLLTAPEPGDLAGDWRARLETLARRYTDGSDVVVEVRVIEGPAADVLTREAERIGADACVVPEDLAPRLLGPLGRPVLVVPAAASRPEVRRG